MENKTFKKLISGTKSLKVVLGLGALAATATVGGAAQAAPTIHSPLQAQTQMAIQTDAKKIIDALRASKNPDVHTAVMQAIAANHGISREAVIAAINSMNYSRGDLVGAVHAVSASMATPPQNVLAEMVTDTFHNKGRDAADSQMTDLKQTFGPEVFRDFSLDNISANNATGATYNMYGSSVSQQRTNNDIASALSQISPAAGGDVYNG